MPKGGLKKGRPLEIWVANTLSLWWSGGERTDLFWHTHNSGGRATIRHQKGKGTSGQYGDICSTDPSSKPFTDMVVVECKRGYNGATLHDLLDRREKAALQPFENWILKAEEDQEAAGSFSWILVTQRDRREAIVTFHMELFNRLKSIEGCFKHGLGYGVRTTVAIGRTTYSLISIPFSDFIVEIEPKHVLSLMKPC